MRNLFYLIAFMFVISCSTNKGVYWCGDHPCINKKEKQAYFKKTMIVEIKQITKGTSNKSSKIEKIIQQAKIDENERIKEEKNISKQAKLEEKRRIKEEKRLAKQAKLEEKRRIKEEKKIINQIERDEKKIIKKEKNISKQSTKITSSLANTEIDSTNFEKLVEKVLNRNTFRPYPDINDIPN